MNGFIVSLTLNILSLVAHRSASRHSPCRNPGPRFINALPLGFAFFPAEPVVDSDVIRSVRNRGRTITRGGLRFDPNFVGRFVPSVFLLMLSRKPPKSHRPPLVTNNIYSSDFKLRRLFI